MTDIYLTISLDTHNGDDTPRNYVCLIHDYWWSLFQVAYDELPPSAFSLINNRMKKGAPNTPIFSADVKNEKPKEINQDTKSRMCKQEGASAQVRNF